MNLLFRESPKLPRPAGSLPGAEASGLTEAALREERLKVLVIDDHQLIREGLKLMLAQIDPASEVLEAESLPSGIDLFRGHHDIDLVLLDLSMPGSYAGNTFDMFLSSCPVARVVVVSASCDAHTVQATLRKGALGFIPKLTDNRALVQAIRFVLDGGIYTVLVEGDDMTEPVADETRSILDGHIILSRALGEANHYPAIDVLASASRVMHALVPREHRLAAGRVRELLARYRDVELLLKVGEYQRGSDPTTDRAIDRREAILQFLRQDMHEISDFDEAVEALLQLGD
ncbi:MAG: response regulator [Hydrogenophaga sp.]|nr:response regulator [Hydrogenophaga sp.]